MWKKIVYKISKLRIVIDQIFYAALVGACFRTFTDNEGKDRGENIKSELEWAFSESRCSIIVLFENYPSSIWCLDELVLILECMWKNSRHVVLPNFYHVDPSDFRKQNGECWGFVCCAPKEGGVDGESESTERCGYRSCWFGGNAFAKSGW